MTDALVILLILLPPVDWLAAIVLGRLAMRYPHVLTLRERAVAAAAIAFVASIAGLLAWSRIGFLSLSGNDALFLLALALTIVSLPSVVWLALLATGRFGLPGDDL
jgi:hypothetical protein